MCKSSEKEDLTWWERNKKKAYIIGGIVVAGAVTAVCIAVKDKNVLTTVKKIFPSKDMLSFNVSEAADVISNNTPSIIQERIKPIMINVPSYIRNLPKGQCHSTKKTIEADALGIILEEGKTLVNKYSYPRSA